MVDVETRYFEPITKLCHRCGSNVSVQVIGPSQFIQPSTKIWLCSNNVQMKGTCVGNAYLSVESWNDQEANTDSLENFSPVHLSDEILKSIAIGDIVRYQSFCKQKLKTMNLWDEQTEKLHTAATNSLETIIRPPEARVC
jgi:hypothetical protein